MNLTASNLANQGTVNTTESEAFRAKGQFSKQFCRMKWQHQGPYVGGVKVDRIVDTINPPPKNMTQAVPGGRKGIRIHVKCNEVTEMVEMMASARAYQNNVEVVNTARRLIMRTLEITKA